jgi:hypothetical protein
MILTKAWSRVSIAGALLAALAALQGCVSVRLVVLQEPTAGQGAASGGPVLGVGFGRVVTVDAEPFDAVVEKGGTTPMLRVLRIDGRDAAADLHVRWTYGGWFAERETDASRNGVVLAPGSRYRLRGYESGAWVGIPPEVALAFDDGFGPVAGVGLHFRSWFRVLDAERLGAAPP